MTTGITEFAAGWSYEETEHGVVVNRVIYWDSTSGVDSTVEVPQLGDILDEDVVGAYLVIPSGISFTGLYCKSRNWQTLAGDPKVVQWNISYTNEPVDLNIFSAPGSEIIPTSIENLPITIEYSGEMTNINPSNAPKTGGWTWKGSGETVTQPIPFKVNASTIRAVRYVRDDWFGDFSWASQYLLGRLNHADKPFGDTIGGGRGCWMLDSVPTEVFRNANNEKWWRAEIIAKYRCPDGSNLDGWQQVMRIDGVWDKPINTTKGRPWTPYLYGYGNFEALFNGTISFQEPDP